MQCYGCRNEIVKAYTCSEKECKKSFCALCANVGQAKVDFKTWICPACRSTERKTGYNSSTTPVRPGNHSENVTMRKKAPSSKPSTPVTAEMPTSKQDMPTVVSTPTSMPATAEPAPQPKTAAPTSQSHGRSSEAAASVSQTEVSVLTSEIRLLTHEISSLKGKLETATLSLNKCHERLDELAATTALADSRLKYLEHSEKQVQSLKITVSQLQNDIRSQAQSQVRNEMEIVGVPEMANESLMHVVLTAASKVGVDLVENDIDWISRAGPRPHKNKPDSYSNISRPIVVRLLRRSKRDALLKAAKTRRNINSTELQENCPNQKVYINERLTWEIRRLFRDARNKSKLHGYSHCWTNHGNIFVRLREGKPAIAIKSYEDLEKLFPEEQNTEPVVVQAQ